MFAPAAVSHGQKHHEYCEPSWAPCIPKLPVSLRHLVFGGEYMVTVRNVDWSGLQGCSDLQHLTLASGQALHGGLGEWVKTARQLYVVDHEPDGLAVLEALEPNSVVPSDDRFDSRMSRLPVLED